MMRLLQFILVITAVSGTVFPQVESVSLSLVTERFQNFAYEEVISLSDELLTAEAITDTTDLLELRRMRAIAFYAGSDARATLTECLEILRLDAEYELDPIHNSPKIINFFEEVKQNLPVEQPSRLEAQPVDSSALLSARLRGERTFRANVLRSLVLPGWGSINQGKRKRGLLIGTAAVSALAASAVLWRRNASRQQDYLNETNRAAINDRYRAYNRSYRQRNIALSLLGAVWLLGQIDVAFFLPEPVNRRYSARIYTVDQALQLQMALHW